MSNPCSAAIAQASGSAGLPTSADSPADQIFLPGSCAWSRASATGLRQILPTQTRRMLSIKRNLLGGVSRVDKQAVIARYQVANHAVPANNGRGVNEDHIARLQLEVVCQHECRRRSSIQVIDFRLFFGILLMGNLAYDIY